MLLVLREAFTGVRRFAAFRRRLGIPRSTLASRLRHLCAVGVLERVVYQERPTREEYRLTEMGRDLYPVALMLWRWERRWLPRCELPVARLVHTRCGQRTEPTLVCNACGEAIRARDTDHRPGPGTALDPPPRPRRWRRSTPSAGGGVTVGAGGVTVGAADLLGDHWLCEVLAAAFFGLRRFDDLQRELGVATNILTDRLKRGVAAEVLDRCRSEVSPSRSEYRLTAKGLDLFPWIVTLGQWGDRWLAGDAGPPLLLRHRRCGAALQTRVVCSACAAPLVPEDVAYERRDPGF